MLWIRENWFWIVVALAFVWMHSGHGGHSHHQPPTSAREDRDHGQH